MSEISREELLTHIGYVRQDIKGVHARLDDLNGRTRENSESIRVLQDRSDRSEQLAEASRADAHAAGRSAGLRWGSGASALIAGLLGALWRLLGGEMGGTR